MTTAKIHIGVLDPETGWYITDDEAYTREEWLAESRPCIVCGSRFVAYFDDDEDKVSRGSPAKICSPMCAEIRHREHSRAYSRKRTAARARARGSSG